MSYSDDAIAPMLAVFDPEPELFGLQGEDSGIQIELWRKLARSLNAAIRRQDDVNINTQVLTQRIAWQHCAVTVAMLEASSDPDGNIVDRSVLTTASQSAYEFNWLMAGGVRDYKLVLGPGAGVASYTVIIDRNDQNTLMARLTPLGESAVMEASPTARPWGMDGLKIQFGQWKARAGVMDFFPSSIAEGAWIYAEQTLPMVTIA